MSTTYAAGLLEPVCRRRLPATPVRRSSSPRMLPTPPPLSPDYRCPSAILLERRPSGRVLPAVPQPATADPSQSPQWTVTSSPRLSPDVITPPIPELAAESEPVESPLMERISDLDMLDHAADTPEGMRSQSSSLSHSIEQLASKSNSDCEDPVAHGLDPSLYGPNAVVVASTSAGDTTSLVHASSSFSGSEPRPTGLGLLHCTLQHFPVRKRLRFSILKIEALAGQLKPDLEIHAQCRVSIPGLKTGKEQTSEVKRGRDPVFNQEFFFDNVTLEDLDTRSIVVMAMHGKETFIGEATVPLREIRELNAKKEVKVVEEIKQQTPKKLGKIHISSCIEKDAKRLTVNIKKAEDLPKLGFTGAPDVCVKITLVQGGKTQTKSSRVLKSTTSAVYNEGIMFLCNTTKNDLNQTKITISVHDMQRTCTGDDVIGCAFLGALASDKSELEQWKNTVEHLGKEYKACHHLKPPQAAPPVHVAEAGELGDCEDPED